MIDWRIVAEALAFSFYDTERAEEHLATAGTVCDWVDDEPDEPTGPAQVAIIYGRDSYTDKDDPRDLDCRSHATTDGRPVAIHLQVHVDPAKQYRCKRVELLENDGSCNVYFVIEPSSFVLNGARTGSPYSGLATGFEDTWRADASPGSIFMGRDASFAPPNLGPIAAFLATPDGTIVSDVVGSMGLPLGRHWSFRIYFEERK